MTSGSQNGQEYDADSVSDWEDFSDQSSKDEDGGASSVEGGKGYTDPLLKCDRFEDCLSSSPVGIAPTSDFSSTPHRLTQLLRRFDCCAHGILQRYIEDHDAPLLKEVVDIFELGIGIPSDARKRIQDYKGKRMEDGFTAFENEDEGLPIEQQKHIIELTSMYSHQARVGLICSHSYPPVSQEHKDTNTTKSQGCAGRWAVTWDAVVEQLWYACVLLESVVGLRRSASREEEEASGSSTPTVVYQVPRQLLARLLPVLYAWAVDWEFLSRFLSVWRRVALTLIRLIPSSLWILHPPPVHLPWRPLLGLVNALTGSAFLSTSLALSSSRFEHLLGRVGNTVMELCAKCSFCFDPDDALQGLWDAFSPSLSRDNWRLGGLSLLFFAQLCPMRAAVVRQRVSPYAPDQTAATTGPTYSDCNRPTNVSPLVVANPIATMLQFIFRDLANEYTPSTWVLPSLSVVGSVAQFHPGAIDLDTYAEPFFTLALRSLGLNEGSYWMRFLRDGEQFPSPFDRLASSKGSGVSILQSIATAVVCCLPTCTTSPLWNHFRRFIHATKVFLHSTGKQAASPRVMTLYLWLVKCARFRILQLKKKLNDESPDLYIDDAVVMRVKKKLETQGAANSNIVLQEAQPLAEKPLDGLQTEAVRRDIDHSTGVFSKGSDGITHNFRGADSFFLWRDFLSPENTWWSNEMTEAFVDIMKDVVLVSLDVEMSTQTISMAAILTQMAPGRMVMGICEKASLAFKHPSQNLTSQAQALQLLQACAFPLLLSAGRCSPSSTTNKTINLYSGMKEKERKVESKNAKEEGEGNSSFVDINHLTSLFMVVPSQGSGSEFPNDPQAPSDVFIAYVQEEIIPRTERWWKGTNRNLSHALIFLFWTFSTLPDTFRRLFSGSDSDSDVFFASTLADYLLGTTDQQSVLSSDFFCTSLRSVFNALSNDAFELMSKKILYGIKRQHNATQLHSLLHILSTRDPSLVLEFGRKEVLPALIKCVPKGVVSGSTHPSLTFSSSSSRATETAAQDQTDDVDRNWACKVLSLCISSGDREGLFRLFPDITKAIEVLLMENVANASGQKKVMKLYSSLFSCLLEPTCKASLPTCGGNRGEQEGAPRCEKLLQWSKMGVCSMQDVCMDFDAPRAEHIAAVKKFFDHLLEDIVYVIQNIADVEQIKLRNEDERDRKPVGSRERQHGTNGVAMGDKDNNATSCCLRDIVVKGELARRFLAGERGTEEKKEAKKVGLNAACTPSNSGISSVAREHAGEKTATTEGLPASSVNFGITISKLIEGITSMLRAVLQINSVFFELSDQRECTASSIPSVSGPLTHWAIKRRCGSLIPYLTLAMSSSTSISLSSLSPRYSVHEIHDVLQQWIVPLVDLCSRPTTANASRFSVQPSSRCLDERGSARIRCALASVLPSPSQTPAPLRSVIQLLEDNEDGEVSSGALISTLKTLLTIANISTSNPCGDKKNAEKGKHHAPEGKEGKYSLVLERQLFFSCYDAFLSNPQGQKRKKTSGGCLGSFFPPLFWNIQAQIVFHSFNGPYLFPSLSLDRKQQILELVYRQFFLGSRISWRITQCCGTSLRIMARQWMIPHFRRKLFRSTAALLEILSFEVLHENHREGAALYRRLMGEATDDDKCVDAGALSGLVKGNCLKDVAEGPVQLEEVVYAQEKRWGSLTKTKNPARNANKRGKEGDKESNEGLSDTHDNREESAAKLSLTNEESISMSCATLEHSGLTKNAVENLFHLLFVWLKNSLLFSCTTSQLQMLKVLVGFPSYVFSTRRSTSLDQTVQNLFFAGIHDRSTVLHNVQQLVCMAARYAHIQPKQSSILLRIGVTWLQPSYSYGRAKNNTGGENNVSSCTLPLAAMLPDLFSLSVYSVGSVQKYARQLLSAVWLSCSTLRMCRTAVLIAEPRPSSLHANSKKNNPVQVEDSKLSYIRDHYCTSTAVTITEFREKYQQQIKKYYPFTLFSERSIRFLPRILTITTCGKAETEIVRRTIRGGTRNSEEALEESYQWSYVAEDEESRLEKDAGFSIADSFASSELDEAVRRFLQSTLFRSSSFFIAPDEIKKSWVWSFLHSTKGHVEEENRFTGRKNVTTGLDATPRGNRFLDSSQILFWNAICRLLGPDISLPLVAGAIQLALEVYHESKSCSSSEAQMGAQSFSISDYTLEKVERYTVILTMGLGCIIATKSLAWQECKWVNEKVGDAGLSSSFSSKMRRSAILEKTIIPLMKAALSQDVLEGVAQNFLLALSYLSTALTQDEVWQLYDVVLCQLENAERQFSDGGGEPSSRWVFNRFRVLSQLFNAFREEITVSLLTPLLVRLHALPYMLWFGRTTLWRTGAGDFLNMIVRFPLSEIQGLQESQEIGEKIKIFLQKDVFNRLDLPKLGVIGDHWPQANANQLHMIKTVGLLLRTPAGVVVESFYKSITSYLLRTLEVSLPEKDDLEHVMRNALMFLAATPVQKTVALQILEFWAGILIKGVVPDTLCDTDEKNERNASSSPAFLHRRSRAVLIHALGILLCHNLHRIGKFATMQRIAEAAINSILSTDDTHTREEAQRLFTILCHVASDEQISSLLHGYEEQLKKTAVGKPTLSSPLHGLNEEHTEAVRCGTMKHKNDEDEEESRFKKSRLAIVSILCAAVLADSGGIPPLYVPRIMRRLVPYADDSSTEVKRVVRSTFESWWKSHRQRWAGGVKARFTPGQVEAMMPLLTAPGYFV